MIQLIRIDDRLLHGQVSFTWTPALGIDCILIANDAVAVDAFQKMALGLAKPAGVKLYTYAIQQAVVFLNDARYEPLRILVLVNSVKDAAALVERVAAIKSINFGGIRSKEGARLVSKAIALTDADMLLIKSLHQKGIELEIRQVPTDKKQMIETPI
jgi:fructoselysine/glucoselysine PTS system EIIB component